MKGELLPDFVRNRDRRLALASLNLGHGVFLRDHSHGTRIPRPRFSSILGSYGWLADQIPTTFFPSRRSPTGRGHLPIYSRTSDAEFRAGAPGDGTLPFAGVIFGLRPPVLPNVAPSWTVMLL